mgnify:FL=1|tara:strand:- start:1061 stop:1453 length:393 start_codon:yes stop_codon:yes gene_type:complete
MAFSDYLEDKLLKHTFANTAFTTPGTVYLGLFTAAPDDSSGSGTEVSGGSYARISCAFSVSGTSPTTATNSSAAEFATATGSWGSVGWVAVFDASTSGNMLAWSALTTAKTVSSGDVFRFDGGDLDITLS